MDLATFLVQCLNAVQYGLLLFLVASGLTLIFGIMGVINLAHGSFYMIGAYMAFVLAPWFGDWYLTKLLAGVILAAVFGYVLEWLFFSYLYQREHLQQVLMTYALILVFEELRSMLVGNDVHGVQAPTWLAGGFKLGRAHELPVVPGVRLGGVHRAGHRAVLGGEPHAPGHDDPRGRQQPRHGAWTGHRHPAAVPHRVRWRRGAGRAGRHDWPRRCHRCIRAWAAACSSSASWWW